MRSKRSNKFKPQKIAFKFLIVIIVLFLILVSAVAFKTYSSKDRTYQGVFVEDIDMSSLTQEELKSKVSDYYSNLLDTFNVTFTYKDMFNETFSASDLGFFYNTDDITSKVFSFGKDGNIVTNSLDRLNLKSNPENFSFKAESNPDALKEKLSEVRSKIDKDKLEPTISFNGDSVSASKEETGYKLDLDKLSEEIVKDIDSHSHKENSCSIELPVEELKPELTQDLVNNMVILGTYSTPLPELTGGRTHNIRTYLSKLNGTILMPGDVFSADKEGEDRNESNGYTYAPGFINNKVVDILAGGICQGVTTLYNSVLYADLNIVERAPHSLPVTYAPIGRDATMAKDVVDFKFKNSLNNPVIVQTYITNTGQVKATIWGLDEHPEKEVVIDVDQHGPKSSTTYKETYENGILVNREVLSKDKYN